jgi:hypothetical protein
MQEMRLLAEHPQPVYVERMIIYRVGALTVSVLGSGQQKTPGVLMLPRVFI